MPTSIALALVPTMKPPPGLTWQEKEFFLDTASNTTFDRAIA
jgi:hypothetical protein